MDTLFYVAIFFLCGVVGVWGILNFTTWPPPALQTRALYGIQIPADVRIVSWGFDQFLGPDLTFEQIGNKSPTETMNNFWRLNPPPAHLAKTVGPNGVQWKDDSEQWSLEYLPKERHFQFVVLYDK